jgi:hypothetical protein
MRPRWVVKGSLSVTYQKELWMNVTRSIVGGLAAAGLVLGLGSAASATPGNDGDYGDYGGYSDSSDYGDYGSSDCCKKKDVEKKKVEKKEVEKKKVEKKVFVKEIPKKEFHKKEFHKFPKKHHKDCCDFEHHKDSHNDYDLDFESEIEWESVIINTFGH